MTSSGDSNHLVIEGEYTTAKVFVDDESDLNPETQSQLYEIVNHPAFTEQIRVMPDVHAGSGVVVGFTMQMGERIIPEVVGGDIGCGMRAWKLGETLPLDNATRDERVRERVPGGGRNRDAPVDLATDFPFDEAMHVFRQFKAAYEERTGDHISPPFDFDRYDSEYVSNLFDRIDTTSSTAARDLGTLGGGNHFIEFGRSVRDDEYWLVIHSGSRRLGKAVAKYWQERADGHPQLGWLEGEQAHGYFIDMIFCQQFAVWNRKRMGAETLSVLDVEPGDVFGSTHNYIDFRDLVIRKGATRSYPDERLIIPLDAANGILLCKGTGNADANFSAPHGAGRVLSRGEAKSVLDIDAFEDALDGVYASNIDNSLISEAPQAYKEPDFLLDQLEPLAEPVDHLEPVHNIKHR